MQPFLKHYNFEMKLSYMGGEIQEQLNGVITENGKTIYLIGMWNDLECYKWQSEDDLKKLSDDRDSALAPACDYKIQPENQGKLVWLTGTPGAGKSTIGHLMSKEAGYVYYDSDAAEAFLNPFISPNSSENPTKQCYRQKPLKVCIFLNEYPYSSKGSSINDVTQKFRFFNPLPPLVTPCHLCLINPLR